MASYRCMLALAAAVSRYFPWSSKLRDVIGETSFSCRRNVFTALNLERVALLIGNDIKNYKCVEKRIEMRQLACMGGLDYVIILQDERCLFIDLAEGTCVRGS